jgi:hypothetical protein
MQLSEQITKNILSNKVTGVVTIQLFEEGKKVKEIVKHNTSSDITRTLSAFPYTFAGICTLLAGAYSGSMIQVNSPSINTITLDCLSTTDTVVDPKQVFSLATRVGYARIDSAYVGTSTKRGTINASESSISMVDLQHVKYHIVVDFTTNAGNGTFNEIQLAPLTMRDLSYDGFGVTQEITSMRTITSPPTDVLSQGYTVPVTMLYITYITLPSGTVNYYTKFFNLDQSAMWWVFNGYILKVGMTQVNSLLETHQVHFSDGTTPFTYQVYLDTTDYLMGYITTDTNYVIYHISKSTWNADAQYNAGTPIWVTSVPISRFALNGHAWVQEGSGACSANGEIYWFGYTTEVVNSVTVYHHRLLILDVTLSIIHDIALMTTASPWSCGGVIGLKDYLIIQQAGSMHIVVRRSDFKIVGLCDGTPQQQNYDWLGIESTFYSSTVCCSLSHNVDNNIRAIFNNGTNYFEMFEVFPTSFLNKVILDTPVTKTSLNTMKIQYDVTLEFPTPTITL